MDINNNRNNRKVVEAKQLTTELKLIKTEIKEENKEFLKHSRTDLKVIYTFMEHNEGSSNRKIIALIAYIKQMLEVPPSITHGQQNN